MAEQPIRSKAQRRRVKALPESGTGKWFVVTDPDLDVFAGPYDTRSEAVALKNSINAILREGDAMDKGNKGT